MQRHTSVSHFNELAFDHQQRAEIYGKSAQCHERLQRQNEQIALQHAQFMQQRRELALQHERVKQRYELVMQQYN